MSGGLIQGLFDGGAMPVLERLTQFTAQRHKILTNNIANLSTPYFKPRDLDTKSFQAALAKAVDKRRQRANPTGGPLQMSDTRELHFEPHGMRVRPEMSNDNIMFHDQNNRNLERTMQHLAENTMAHNMGVEFLRSELSLIRLAIRGRL